MKSAALTQNDSNYNRRQSFTELQGCAIPKEVRIFLVEYCVLSGVCLLAF